MPWLRGAVCGRSRGGDGFAFVVQNQAPTALGAQGMELGYGGIQNSLAIEFDTWYNPETLDPMENHVSVHTKGWRGFNSANHTYQLGATTQGVSDMSDGIHDVRIIYQPQLDLDSLDSESFMATPHMSDFVTNGDFPGGGQGDWGIGMGLLKVFVNSKTVPVLTVPLNIEATLALDNGCVGCAVGDEVTVVLVPKLTGVGVLCAVCVWPTGEHGLGSRQRLVRLCGKPMTS